MIVSAALQFRGKSSTTWSTLSLHNFVGFNVKAHSRGVCVSCSVPYSSLFLVALSVPKSQLYTTGNHTSTFIVQETVEIGRPNTLTSAHAASNVQENSKEVEGMHLKDSSDVLVNHSEHCAKGSAKDFRGSVSPDSTDSSTKKRRVAWNKGRRLSEEAKDRIRAGTRQAMENPKIRERLRKAREGSTQSAETKMKIKSGVMNFWELKREAQRMQESCVREWEELIADTARRGANKDMVYSWDSYDVILEELRNAHKKIQAQKARRCRKSAEHKRKISEAIRAKWADPNYRKRVRTGLNVYLSSMGDLSPSSYRGVNMLAWTDSVATPQQAKPAVPSKKPEQPYKDPMAHHKLEKLKQMRSSRHFDEDRKQREMMERAWVLMTQAKRAADALEASKVKDKNAVASLKETRRLLAEAEHVFECAGVRIDWVNDALSEGESVEASTAGNEVNGAYSVVN